MNTALENLANAGLRSASRAKKFFGLRSGFAEVQAELQTIRTEATRLEQRRAFLVSAPLCLSDTHGLLCDHITRSAELYTAALDMHTGYDPEASAARFDPSHQHVLINRYGLGQAGQTHTALVEGFLCCMFADVIRDGLRRELEKKDWSQSGPPMTERRVEIGRIDARLASLKADEQEILDQLSALQVKA